MNKPLLPILYQALLWIIAIYAGIASTISICTYFHAHDNSNLTFDYQGIIVGILSMLVTVLMTWNIAVAIDAKDKIKTIDSFKDDIGKLRIELEANASNSNADSYYNQGIFLASIKPHSHMRQIEAFVKALKYLISYDEAKDKEEVSENIDIYLKQIERCLDNRMNDKSIDDEIKYKKDFIKDMDTIMISPSKAFSSKQRSRFAIMQRNIIQELKMDYD